jgi:hypothetical protein
VFYLLLRASKFAMRLFSSPTPPPQCLCCVQYHQNKRIITTGSYCNCATIADKSCHHPILPSPTTKMSREGKMLVHTPDTRQEDALKVENVMVHPCWFYANLDPQIHILLSRYMEKITIPTGMTCENQMHKWWTKSIFSFVHQQQQHIKNGCLWLENEIARVV